ncbi:MerR family DNA-binding transcriptional regulator [Paenibacillus sp. FJAT-27812]
MPLKISQLAKRTGIGTRSVRHYEEKGLMSGFQNIFNTVGLLESGVTIA